MIRLKFVSRKETQQHLTLPHTTHHTNTVLSSMDKKAFDEVETQNEDQATVYLNPGKEMPTLKTEDTRKLVLTFGNRKTGFFLSTDTDQQKKEG